jgi:hypothetical protein
MKSTFRILRKKTSALQALTLLAGISSAGAANAGVVFVSFGTPPGPPPAIPPGESLVTDFATAAGLTGAYLLVTGRIANETAQPAYTATSGDKSQYLAVLGGDAATLALPSPTEAISLYIGSLDAYNSISFFDGATEVDSFTGKQLSVPFTTAEDNQRQIGQLNSDLSNGRFYFTFSSPVTSIEFASGKDSFEIAQVADVPYSEGAPNFPGAVPEPSTWAMMLLGFSALGLTGFLRTQKASPAPAPVRAARRR